MHHQDLFGVPEIIRIELTSRFDIKKTQELVARTKTTWARFPMSTDWNNTSYNSILLIVGLYDEPVQIPIKRLKRHESQLGRDCLCLPIEKTRATI